MVTAGMTGVDINGASGYKPSMLSSQIIYIGDTWT